MSDPDALDSDVTAIRALAEVLDATGLTEIEIERGSVRLRIAKTPAPVAATVAPGPVAGAAPQASTPAGSTPAADASGSLSEADLAKHPGAVTSPMVGTAYLAPTPGTAPFVQAGDQVRAGQTILIVEAMKTMNEIKAHTDGKVREIFARDAEPIEFGEVLMIIE